MANEGKTGTMVLPTHSAMAIWRHEITGQISDGRWENATPRNHHRFWCRLECRVIPGAAPAVVERTGYALRANYNLRALLNNGDPNPHEIRDRMVWLGRMGLAAQILGLDDVPHAWAARNEDLPGSLEEFRALRARKLATETDAYWIKAWFDLNEEFAAVLYGAGPQAYGVKDMKADVERIKSAMLTAA